MKIKFYAFIIPFLAFLICSCKNEQSDYMNAFSKDKNFPPVRNLDTVKGSKFLPTMETEFDSKLNGIYAVSLLYAWNEIRDTLKPIRAIKDKALLELNASKSFLSTLNRDEYQTSIGIKYEDNTKFVTAKAFFKKNLAFEHEFKRNETAFLFMKTKVQSFSPSTRESYNQINISYYNNDHDFAIRLAPKDTAHEIILLKTAFDKKSSLSKIWKKYENTVSGFKKNRHDGNVWCYYFNSSLDELKIPILSFHLENNYKELMGNLFIGNDTTYYISKAYQRTAFVLNEKGAIAESEAEIEVPTTEEMVERELPRPKNLIFDKTFVVFLKRKDSKYPYFAFFVANSDWMLPWSSKTKN